MITLKDDQIQDVFNKRAVRKDGINDILRITLDAIMYAEREAFLKRENSENNKANGYRPIKVNGYGRQLALAVPRDRTGTFKPVLMLALKEQAEEKHQLCFKLYREGLTTRRISKILADIYQERYAQSTISGMTQTFKEQLEAWRSRPLQSRYLVVYLDAIHSKVRRGNSVQGEAFYAALAVKEDYTRETIYLSNNPTESTAGWDNVLKDLKKRGVEAIDLVVADGIVGLEEKVLANFPTASFQKCVTHLKRNILNSVRPGDKQKIAADLKSLFDISDNRYNRKKAHQKAEEIIMIWQKKYPALKKELNKENLRPFFTCLDFDYRIRRMIYTTNAIERLHKEFRRALKIRNAMPSVDSVLLLLSAISCEMEETTYKHPIYNFSYEPKFQRK